MKKIIAIIIAILCIGTTVYAEEKPKERKCYETRININKPMFFGLGVLFSALTITFVLAANVDLDEPKRRKDDNIRKSKSHFDERDS